MYKHQNLDADKLRSNLFDEQFSENYSLLNLVRGSESSISTRESLRPILATVGIGPCIAMAGYDTSQGIGFLSHNGVGDYVDILHDLVLEELNNHSKSRLEMEIYIVGGMMGSGQLARKLRENAKKFNPKRINEDLALKISDLTYIGKSFAIDVRDGKVYSLDGKGKLQYLPPAEPLISLKNEFRKYIL
ncbi:MAG: hypothetical protein WCT85_03445 [Parachlamydiales bacterium]